jgi:hypothetical protein
VRGGSALASTAISLLARRVVELILALDPQIGERLP